MRRPPYRIDEISTHVVGARLTRVPLRDWAHDLDAMARIAADIYVEITDDPDATTCLPLVASGRVAGQPARRARHRRAPRHRARHPRHGPGQRALPARPAPPAQRAQTHPWPAAGRVMPTHGDRITMIRHMALLGALGAGAFGGRQRGDGFQLRLVLERGNPPSPTANHASCVGVSQPTTSAPTPPVTRFRVLADSEPSPSQ